MPLVESVAPQQAAQIREALSQMQLAYVRIGGTAPADASSAPAPAADSAPAAPGPASDEPAPDATKPGDPGPAQRSGRLWIPGQ
jgi:hypothetical protein